MDNLSDVEQANELLQQLGLKEYEAKCFVALSRLPSGTAKEVSETSEVPRTRVYDAVRVLETRGLVEVQHTNPQRFRAVSVDEAADTLRAEFAARTDSLRETLRGMEPATSGGETEVTHEVWALSGGTAIANRTRQLIDGATEELVLVVGHEHLVTDELIEALRSAQEQDVTVVVGAISESLREQVQSALPDAEVFVSELEWLSKSALPGDETEIGRLLLVDRTTILVSTFTSHGSGSRGHEQAVFGDGFDNGLVAIVRRLMATGFLQADGASETRNGSDLA